MVTFCHKADVMRLSDGLFLECARTVAGRVPVHPVRGEADRQRLHGTGERSVGVRRVGDGNLFGDVISDLAAGLVGGLGVVPGRTTVAGMPCSRRFTAAPRTSRGRVGEPRSRWVRSAALLLGYVGHHPAAKKIEKAVAATLQNGVGLTRDLGGEGTTATITEQIIKNLGA